MIMNIRRWYYYISCSNRKTFEFLMNAPNTECDAKMYVAEIRFEILRIFLEQVKLLIANHFIKVLHATAVPGAIFHR